MAYFRKYTTTSGALKWRVEIRIKGAKPTSKSFSRKTDAQVWARQEEERMQRIGAGIQQARKATLNEAIDRYLVENVMKRKDHATIRTMLEWWQDRMGERFIDCISASEIVRLRRDLETDPLNPSIVEKGGRPQFRKPRTVQGYVNALSLVLSLAVLEWGWLSANPVNQVKKLKYNDERTRFLSDHAHLWPSEDKPRHWDKLTKEQKAEAVQKFPRAYEMPRLIRALMAQTDERNGIVYKPMWAYYLFTIQLSAGLRLGEARHMVWEENDLITHPIVIADMATQTLILKSTKHDTKPRIKPICGAMLAVLKELYANRRYDTPLVFPRQDGQQPFDFTRRIERAIAEAQLQDFRWHDLRHTTASYLSMMGASQREIMEALHHRNLRSSQRYTHLSHAHMRGLMDKFSETVLESAQSPSRF